LSNTQQMLCVLENLSAPVTNRLSAAVRDNLSNLPRLGLNPEQRISYQRINIINSCKPMWSGARASQQVSWRAKSPIETGMPEAFRIRCKDPTEVLQWCFSSIEETASLYPSPARLPSFEGRPRINALWPRRIVLLLIPLDVYTACGIQKSCQLSVWPPHECRLNEYNSGLGIAQAGAVEKLENFRSSNMHEEWCRGLG
jgi:hypothetical protein